MPSEVAMYALLASAATATVMSANQPTPVIPATPTATPPTAMPTPGDAATKAAQRASIAEQLRRRGRASTILTDQTGTTDKLGG